MFLSLTQIQKSLEALANIHPFFGTSFLAFKQSNLPVDGTKTLNFSSAVNQVLRRYYAPLASYQGFYSPFATSNKNNRWQNKRYGSTTVQRITADTFGDAFLHTKQSQEWGWRADYVEALASHLEQLNTGKIPAFHLAVWLFRQEVWKQETTRGEVRDEFLRAFSIDSTEAEALFDLELPDEPQNWLQEERVSDGELLNLIGYPSDAPPTKGAVLHSLELHDIGPARQFLYRPAERLNIITGDNSLGKTFLFDCIWWALTGTWVSTPARPRSDSDPKIASIAYEVQTGVGKAGHIQKVNATFDRNKQRWNTPKGKSVEAGLVIYARYDGAFTIWDSTRRELSEVFDGAETATMTLSRENVWDGKSPDGSRNWLCNGLIRDWVNWQRSGAAGAHFEREWKALRGCISCLSPAGEPLAAGEPTRTNLLDDRDIPTIVLPYGAVPLTHASAGVQRILALAYVLVWAWFRHLKNSEILRQEPQSRLVLLMDEVEAHLHPRWQRIIVPALMKALGELSSVLAPQIHLATHSPMVMASTEVVFDEARDDLHHLRLEGREVVLEELPFIKRGRADAWLISEVFGLDLPLSKPAEDAVKRAKAIQLQETPAPEEVAAIDAELKQTLSENDPFWPRWRFFAKEKGAK